jgi:hypothetical protein
VFALFLFFYGGFWASRFAAFGGLRRAIRSITFALRASVVPLLSLSHAHCRTMVRLGALRGAKNILNKQIFLNKLARYKISCIFAE